MLVVWLKLQTQQLVYFKHQLGQLNRLACLHHFYDCGFHCVAAIVLYLASYSEALLLAFFVADHYRDAVAEHWRSVGHVDTQFVIRVELLICRGFEDELLFNERDQVQMEVKYGDLG